MTKRIDALVVGGGSAGATAALALAQAGLEVKLVERRGPERAGAHWINGVPAWCFDRARVARPRAPERWGGEHGASRVHLTAAGSDTSIRIESAPTLHVDMRRLVRRLQDEAQQAGVDFERGSLDSVRVRGGRVSEVELSSGTVRPALVVDASGMKGVVRKRVPELHARCRPSAPLDTCAAAQETYEVADQEGLRAYLRDRGAEPGDSVGTLGTAGGYSTLSLFTEPELREVGVLTGSIPAMGEPSGAQMMRTFVSENPWLGKKLFGGRGPIPLRRPYRTLGRSGVALVGDAACQVYGAHGSGVGMGMMAARMMADAVSAGDDPGSDAALRRYERRFHRSHHGLLAGADSFRRFSQRLPHRQLVELIDSGLFDAELFYSGLDQQPPRVGRKWILETARKAAGSPRAALRVGPAVGRVVALQRLGVGLGLVGHEPSRRVLDGVIDWLVGQTPETRG